MEITQQEVQEYKSISDQISALEKKKKVLNEKFKKALGAEKKNYTFGDLEVKIIPQDKSKVNGPLAISFIKGAKADYIEKKVTEDLYTMEEAIQEASDLFDPCIKTEEVLVESAVENLVYNGHIVPSEFQEQCVDHVTVVTLRIDPVKVEKADEI